MSSIALAVGNNVSRFRTCTTPNASISSSRDRMTKSTLQWKDTASDLGLFIRHIKALWRWTFSSVGLVPWLANQTCRWIQLGTVIQMQCTDHKAMSRACDIEIAYQMPICRYVSISRSQYIANKRQPYEYRKPGSGLETVGDQS
jgi:hypothetical protein